MDLQWFGLGTLLVAVLGASGLAGWYLTWRQLKEQARREAQRVFREFVLTSEFIDFLNMVFWFW
jgi:hypothetical protein